MPATEGDQNMPLNTIEGNGQARKKKQSIMPLIGKRKFKFAVNEEKVRELLNEKCRRYRPRVPGSRSGRSSLDLGLNKLDAIASDFKLANDGMKTIKNIPDELLPRHKKEAALLAKQKEAIYAKPEHWLVMEKKIVTPSEMAQIDKARISSRLESMKQFSRAANILNMVAKPGEKVGPIRKKRAPVFDGLICRR